MQKIIAPISGLSFSILGEIAMYPMRSPGSARSLEWDVTDDGVVVQVEEVGKRRVVVHELSVGLV